MATQKKNLDLIQLLRGIASVLVVLMHITLNYSEKLKSNFLLGIFNFGGSGVDLFFVLSGFIITYSHFKHIGNAGTTIKFLKRRFIRIFPIYWVIITLFLALQLLLPSFYKTHFDTGIQNLFQTYLLLPGHSMINGVSWSLTNELYFYLIFTLALVIPNKKVTLYLAISYFILLIIVAISGIDWTNGNKYIGIVFFQKNIEFLFGVFIVLIYDKIPKKLIVPLLILGIMWFTFGAILEDTKASLFGGEYHHGSGRVAFQGFASFLIVLALVKMELNKKIKINNLFLLLGDASYSIYLIHLPFVAAFFSVVAKFHISNYFFLLFLTCLLLVSVCFIGIIFYKLIERPLINKLNKILL